MNFDVNKNYPMIRLEKQGENLARKIVFDLSAWKAEYGAGNVSLLFQRSQDVNPYPIPLTLAEDGTATWRPTSTDMQYDGDGMLQIVYTVGSVIIKSAVYKAYVSESLGTSVDPPSPLIPWMEAVIAARDRAEAAADEAEEIAELLADTTASASVNNAYGTPSVVVTKTLEDEDTDDEHYNFDFAFSNLKGKGITSIAKTSTSGLNDEYTITYDGGTTTTYTIKNGNGIRSIVKTATVGLVDTYTITFDNNSTSVFYVSNGNGITSVVLRDDYTLRFTFANGETYTTGSIRGEKGEKGDTGQTGAKGDPGDSGVYVGSGTPPLSANVWINPEGGTGDVGNTEIIDFELTQSGGAWVAESDVTPTQAMAKVNDGKALIARAEFGGGYLFGYLQCAADLFEFDASLYDSGNLEITHCVIRAHDATTWECAINESAVPPKIGSSDIGRPLVAGSAGFLEFGTFTESQVDFVNFSIYNDTLSYASKTPSQVRDIIDAGKLPIAKITKNLDRPMYGYIQPTGMSSSGYLINFQSLMFTSNAENIWGVIIRETSRALNSWTLNVVEEHKLHPIPSYSSVDAGKVLSVNSSGELEWISLT